jgi:hypothetical protein
MGGLEQSVPQRKSCNSNDSAQYLEGKTCSEEICEPISPRTEDDEVRMVADRVIKLADAPKATARKNGVPSTPIAAA